MIGNALMRVQATPHAVDRRTVDHVLIERTVMDDGGSGVWVELKVGNGRALLTQEQACSLEEALRFATAGRIDRSWDWIRRRVFDGPRKRDVSYLYVREI